MTSGPPRTRCTVVERLIRRLGRWALQQMLGRDTRAFYAAYWSFIRRRVGLPADATWGVQA